MTVGHVAGLGPRLGSVPHNRETSLCLPHRDRVVDERRRVIAADDAAGRLLHVHRHRPRHVDIGRRQTREFRHPAADEYPPRILVDRLLRGVIDPQRIDARGARLHLQLRPVDARFKVEEVTGEMQAGGPPMQPERVARERHEQGPHPKREPARRQQASHAGIDERVAGVARLPSGQPLWHNLALPQAVSRPQHVFKLDRRLVLQLLHEVAMPVQPRLHALEAPLPGLALCLLPRALSRGESGLHVEPPSLTRLPDPPHRDRAKRECGAQSGAARRGRHRATDATGIVAAAQREKIFEHLACRPFATPLPVFRVGRQAELAAPENAE